MEVAVPTKTTVSVDVKQHFSNNNNSITDGAVFSPRTPMITIIIPLPKLERRSKKKKRKKKGDFAGRQCEW